MEHRMKAYHHALVLQTKWDITDYHDEQAIKAAKQSHNQGMLRIIEQLNLKGFSGVMAGASSCTLCERCAILDGEPCRDPKRQFSCLSAYCIYVKKLAEACNMEYACADGRLAFFGMYAF
jgi:predicted metal-binding protein